MAPLIPIALSVLPELGRWIFGERGAAAAQAAAQAVQTLTGAENPHAARTAIEGDPALAARVRVELARIAAEAEQDARAHELAQLRAVLSDVAGARAQTVDLARSGSGVQWSAPLISAIVVGAFAGVLWVVMTRALPAGSDTIVNMLLGTLATMAAQVVNYWLGSSAGSAAKNNLLMREPRP